MRIQKKKVEKERFIAKSEDGREFHLIWYEIQKFLPTMGPIQNIKGLPEVRTSTGYPCTIIDEDNFVIDRLGIRVKRIQS